jgi:hypothetical protein
MMTFVPAHSDFCEERKGGEAHDRNIYVCLFARMRFSLIRKTHDKWKNQPVYISINYNLP